MRSRIGPAVFTVLGGALILTGVSRILGFPSGYASAQSSTAGELAARSDWSALRRATSRDLFVFIPAYLLVGVGATWWLIRERLHRQVIAGLLALGAVADVVETALFRGSLSELIDGATASEIVTSTSITRVASTIKLLALGLAVVWLMAVATRRPRPTQQFG